MNNDKAEKLMERFYPFIIGGENILANVFQSLQKDSEDKKKVRFSIIVKHNIPNPFK